MSEPGISAVTRMKASLLKELKLSNWLQWWEDFLNKSGHYGYAGLEVVEGESSDFVPRMRSDVHSYHQVNSTTGKVVLKFRAWDANAERELVSENQELRKRELTTLKERGVLWADMFGCLHAKVIARLKATDLKGFKMWQAQFNCVELCLKLEKVCQGVSRDRLKDLRKDLQDIFQAKTEDFDTFCVRLETLFEQLEEAGDYMDERQKMEHMCCAVDQTFFESMLRGCLENEISSDDYPEYNVLVPKMAEFCRKKLLALSGMKRKVGGNGGDPGKATVVSGETDDLGNPKMYTEGQMKRMKKKIRAEVMALVAKDVTKKDQAKVAVKVTGAIFRCFMCGLTGHRSNDATVCKAKNVKCGTCNSARHCTSMHDTVAKFKTRTQKAGLGVIEVRELPEAEEMFGCGPCAPCPVDLIIEELDFGVLEVKSTDETADSSGNSSDDDSSDGSSDSSGENREYESAAEDEEDGQEEEGEINPPEPETGSGVVTRRSVSAGTPTATATEENLVDSENETPTTSKRNPVTPQFDESGLSSTSEEEENGKRVRGNARFDPEAEFCEPPVDEPDTGGLSAVQQLSTPRSPGRTEGASKTRSHGPVPPEVPAVVVKPAAGKGKGKGQRRVLKVLAPDVAPDPLPDEFDEMNSRYRAIVHSWRRRQIENKRSFIDDINRMVKRAEGVEALRKAKGVFFGKAVQDIKDSATELMPTAALEKAVYLKQQEESEELLDQLFKIGIKYNIALDEDIVDRFQARLLSMPIVGYMAHPDDIAEEKAEKEKAEMEKAGKAGTNSSAKAGTISSSTPAARAPGQTGDSASVKATPVKAASVIKKRAAVPEESSEDEAQKAYWAAENKKAQKKANSDAKKLATAPLPCADEEDRVLTAEAERGLFLLAGRPTIATAAMTGPPVVTKLQGKTAAERDGGAAALETLEQKRQGKAVELRANLKVVRKPSVLPEPTPVVAKAVTGVKRSVPDTVNDASDHPDVEASQNVAEETKETKADKNRAKKKRRQANNALAKEAEVIALDGDSPEATGQGVKVMKVKVKFTPAPVRTESSAKPGELEPGEISEGEAMKPVVGEPVSTESYTAKPVPAEKSAPAVQAEPDVPVEPEPSVADVCAVEVDMGMVIQLGFMPKVVKLNGPHGGQILALVRMDGRKVTARDIMSLVSRTSQTSGAGTKTKISMIPAEELEADMANGTLYGFVVPASFLAIVREAVLSGKRIFVVDSGASTVVLRKWEFGELTPINTNFEMTAANGQKMSIDKAGYKKGIGKVIVSKESRHDVLSVSQLCDANPGACVSFTSEGVLITHPAIPEGVRGGRTKTGLYAIDLAGVQALINGAPERAILCPVEAKPTEVISVSTEVLVPKEVRRANAVQQLHIALGHPSDEQLINALTHGTVLGTDLTARDVVNARKHLGAARA